MRTSELQGATLDYYVARAEGLDAAVCAGRFVVWHRSDCGKIGCTVLHKRGRPLPRYSTDWAQGGPLIEKYSVDIFSGVDFAGDLPWKACAGLNLCEKADTPLQAICRAVVRAKFGNEVAEVAVNG